MLVVDTSAILLALADPTHKAAQLMADSNDLHAPHLLDIEYLHSVRRLLRQGELDEVQASQLISSLSEVPIERYSHTLMAARIWELRHNLTAYDAAFVALAEALNAPLVTADARMAAAPGNSAQFQVV